MKDTIEMIRSIENVYKKNLLENQDFSGLISNDNFTKFYIKQNLLPYVDISEILKIKISWEKIGSLI